MRRSSAFLALPVVFAFACSDQPTSPDVGPGFDVGGVRGPPPGKGPPPGVGPPPGTPAPPGAGPPGFLADFVAIGAGGPNSSGFSCGLTSDGSTFCWGNNGNGQLGNGTQVSSSTPVSVSGDLSFVDLTVGDSHACGLTIDGTAYCWGSNFRGPLGAGLPAGSGNLSTVPVAVSSGKQFNTIDAGLAGTCGVATDGVTYCWGDNSGFGGGARLGDGSTVANSNVPVAVTNSSSLGFQTVTAGFAGACALTGAGSLYCWGTDGGMFGNGDALNAGSSTPVAAGGGATFADIAAGSLYMCGLDSSGGASCWSFNNATFGQLGNGSTTPVFSPTQVAGGLSFDVLDSHDNNSFFSHTCGVTTVGDAYCWGSNQFGQLGAPSSETCNASGFGNFDCATTPLAVVGDIVFVDIAVGISHTCAVVVDGAAYCWGSNSDGQLGDGTTNDTSVPVAVQIP